MNPLVQCATCPSELVLKIAHFCTHFLKNVPGRAPLAISKDVF